MDPGTPSSSQSLTDFHEPLTTSNETPGMQYDEAFPALPPNPSGPNSGPTSGISSPGASSKWSQKMRIGSNIVTSVFHIPFEERSDRGHERFGETTALKICAEISKLTEAHIEMSSSSKDQSLTFLVSGKISSVMAAKREILQRFQTQAQKQVNIPKEHHRFILGKQGGKLADLEKATATKITIPRTNEDSNFITIIGTREGIEKAEHEIRLISDEQSKQASERIPIHKKFHPFICGPYNEKVNRLIAETGAKINIPPPSVMNDEISVFGEKEGVIRAVQQIKKEHEEAKRYVTVSIEVGKSQHKYIIGPKRGTINDILKETGVSVEMPPSDSPSETITLRGPPDALGNALTMVYDKANSVVARVVEAPSWLHKYVIGKGGSNIRNITSGYDKAHVEISETQNQINIEGPPEHVEPVTQLLTECVNNLLRTMYFKDISVDTKHYKHIIGKSGSNINRLKDETGITISVKDGNQAVIHLEGTKEGVEKAAKMLMEQVEKMENEKERDLIIEHRFHGNIIGSKGEKVREIRDMFNQVQIAFPAPGEKRDVVTIRGPKDDVDKCARHMTKLYREMLENSYQLKVPIFAQCYKLVIGKGGANIRKIREETQTRFDLPPLEEGKSRTEAEIIVITGRKENCEAARDKLLNIQNSVANVIESDVMIPSKFHNSLIGAGGRLIRSISEECGGVQIKFPDSKSKSDRVVITGPKEDVERAKKQLFELSREKETNSYTENLEAKAQSHRFLIGKNGSTIRRIRESTGARIIFPNEGDAQPDVITLIGKKESVQAAKKELTEMLKDLEKVTESEMSVEPQYHRHFVLRRGEVLRQIADELGGVSISFPKAGTNSTRVVLKGPPECVEAAKKRINEIVADLKQRITIDVVIEHKHHRTIMGSGGSKVKKIQSDFNVDIKFPDRVDDSNGTIEENGDGSRPADIIRVSGRPEACEAAKAALLEQVPVTVEVDIPYKHHRHVIGAKGKDVRELMKIHDVHITVPPSEEQSDTIKILGSPKNANAAKDALLNLKDELEEKEKDREAQSFEVVVDVDSEFHPKLIGRGGEGIRKMRDQFGVNIQLPRRDDPEPNKITIQGYEAKALAARDEILKFVRDIVDREKYKVEVDIDHRVHSRIIGSRGKNVKMIMKDYEVDIRFPRANDKNPNMVVISGPDEDKVYDARDHLLNLEDEHMQDVIDNEYMQTFVKNGNASDRKEKKEKQNNGFVVQGAPWEQPPDTQSTEDFPTFGNNSNDATRPISSAWGARGRHF